MNINITLIGQAITFAIFVWFNMKYVWPPIMQAMNDREKKIADGLAAANKSQESLEIAEQQVTQMLTEARAKSAEIIEHAHKQSNLNIEASKAQAREEGQRLKIAAEADIEQLYTSAREQLRVEVATLSVTAAQRILSASIDKEVQDQMLEKLASEL